MNDPGLPHRPMTTIQQNRQPRSCATWGSDGLALGEPLDDERDEETIPSETMQTTATTAVLG